MYTNFSFIKLKLHLDSPPSYAKLLAIGYVCVCVHSHKLRAKSNIDASDRNRKQQLLPCTTTTIAATTFVSTARAVTRTIGTVNA